MPKFQEKLPTFTSIVIFRVESARLSMTCVQASITPQPEFLNGVIQSQTSAIRHRGFTVLWQVIIPDIYIYGVHWQKVNKFPANTFQNGRSRDTWRDMMKSYNSCKYS